MRMLLMMIVISVTDAAAFVAELAQQSVVWPTWLFEKPAPPVRKAVLLHSDSIN